MDDAAPLHRLVRYPQLQNRQWLIDRYVTMRKTKREIAREVGCSLGAVVGALQRHRVDRQTALPEHYGHEYYRCPYCSGTGKLRRGQG